MTITMTFLAIFLLGMLLFFVSVVTDSERLQIVTIVVIMIAVVGMLWSVYTDAEKREDDCRAAGGDRVLNGECYVTSTPIPLD